MSHNNASIANFNHNHTFSIKNSLFVNAGVRDDFINNVTCLLFMPNNSHKNKCIMQHIFVYSKQITFKSIISKPEKSATKSLCS